MRIQTTSPLSECCLKPLVVLTIRSLQNLDPKSESNNPRFDEEPNSIFTSGKRKHAQESTSSRGKYWRKRIKRESTPYPNEGASYSDDEQSTEEDAAVGKSSIVDEVISLRNYFECLPLNLWNRFFCLAIKALNNFTTATKNSRVEIRAFELLFCKKVSSFSTRLISFHVYDKCEDLLLERLRLCRNMKSLEIHYRIQPPGERILLSSIAKLSHIRCVTLLPDGKQSLHAVIPVISHNCQLLEELTLPYESQTMSDGANNISCLKNCKKLRKLFLHSYGRGSEVEYILVLLHELKDLKHFYHRELPHAVTEMSSRYYEENCKKTLNLRTLFLCAYSKCVGSQLCYLPEESLLQIATVCPFLEHIKLVKPPDLSQVVKAMPYLKRLDIHDCDIKESFVHCFSDSSLKNLTSLSLMNTEYIDFGDILLLSNSCPQLQELEITNSNLFWSNDLARTICLFPHIRKLKILKNRTDGQSEPRFVFSQKLYIDKTLTRLLLSSFKVLEKLNLEFDQDAVLSTNLDGLPSKEELVARIGMCKNLKELMLLNCPGVGYEMVNAFVQSCPNLKHLLDIDQWGIPTEEMDKVLRKFSHMFIQSSLRPYS